MTGRTIAEITEKIIKDPEHGISYAEACELAAASDAVIDLVTCAGKIRDNYRKNRVFTCAIINAKSGLCSEDCAFCAQSVHHQTGVNTYPMVSEDVIIKQALRMQDAGATNFSVVTSGFALDQKEIETVTHAVQAIRQRTDLTLCGSLGGLTEALARQLRESGISNYHHNLETSRSHFNEICTTHDYEDDVQTVKLAQAAGLRACSGGILGMGETWEQRVELAFTLKALDVDSIPLNFLTPIAGTRMGHRPLLPPMEAIRTIALFRMINPDKDITICGGRERTLSDFQSWVFLAGANGLMIGDYLTTAGRNSDMDIEMIKALGLTIA